MIVPARLTIAATGFGMIVNAAGSLAQAAPAAGDAGSAIAPWATVGGSAVAVTGLVYIAKLLATGKLVARDPDKAEATLNASNQRLAELVSEGHAREDDSKRREDRLYDLITGGRP